MPPEAHIHHQTSQRLRIRIPSKRKDTAFFSWLEEQLSLGAGFEGVEINAVTGSILFKDEEGVDLEAITAYAQEKQLFTVIEHNPGPSTPSAPLAPGKVAEPVQKFNEQIKTLTGGRISIAILAFLYLFGAGVYQVSKGNLHAPPWYTAFWYAYDLFRKAGLGKTA
jgi:hypothetical protein